MFSPMLAETAETFQEYCIRLNTTSPETIAWCSTLLVIYTVIVGGAGLFFLFKSVAQWANGNNDDAYDTFALSAKILFIGFTLPAAIFILMMFAAQKNKE